jgi:glycosyltransferase involved in cell wall biosynthesis
MGSTSQIVGSASVLLIVLLGRISGRRFGGYPMVAFRSMRIAIMGTRGIPAKYGGFETMAWELSVRLTDRGHRVTVYCHVGRTDETQAVPAGIRRRFLPALRGKYLETVSHTGLCALDAVLHRYDVVLMVNAANAIFAGIPRIRGSRVVLNVDGIERQRAKWGLAGRLWYAAGERFALIFPNVIVADAAVIQDYYRRRYRHPSELIAYGATILPREPKPAFTEAPLDGIRADDYFLYVSRLEPENQALLVIEAYRQVGGGRPLVIVGDAPYASEYKARLQRAAERDVRVRLVGGVYGHRYKELQRGALAYIQATSVGGTHPALIEAMAAGNLVVAYASPENLEVTSGTALMFEDADRLAEHLRRITNDPRSAGLFELRMAALRRAMEHYSWDAVVRRYEAVFEGLCGPGDARP